MIVPEIRCERRAEHTRGIHRSASERSAEQDVESDCRSNGKPRDLPPTALINRSAMNNKDEKKGQDRLDQNSLPAVQVDGQLWRSSNDYVASKQTEADQRSAKSAKQLRDPVSN